MPENTLVTPVAPRRVDPERIETELMKMWNDVTNDIGTDAVLRARSLTLVAFTDDPDREAELQQTLASVSRRHPSRAIVIVERPGSDTEPALDTWVSVHCQMNDHTSLCNEQVMIEASSDVLEQVSSLVLALVVPDLPVAVWWWGDINPDAQIFASLYALSDRFLLDATTFEAPVRSLSVEANELLTDEGYPIVADLAWEETIGWRELIRHVFDVDEWASHLSDIGTIDLLYDWREDVPRNPAEALLIAGWIAAQLGWTPAAASVPAEGHYALTFDAGGYMVDVTIRPTDEPMVFARGIASVTLRTAAESPHEFRLSRQEDKVCGRLHVVRAGDTLHQRIVSLQEPSRSGALDRFLSHMGRDQHFGAALRTLAPMLQQIASLDS